MYTVKTFSQARSGRGGKSSRPKADSFYGHQLDRQGNVWHYVGTPYTSKTEANAFSEYHQVEFKDITATTVNTVELKTRVTVVRVSPISDLVTKTFQQESITRYTYKTSIDSLLESSTKVFDAGGNPTNMSKNEAEVHREAPFIEIDEEGGKNLHELFREFLIAERLTNLLPD